MEFIFWLLLALIFYCYFGYPLGLALLAKFFPRPVKKAAYSAGVSVVVSVHNEEDVIADKIKNLLALDYPTEQVEILLGSDGSSDRTDDIVKSFADPRIRFFPRADRRGKMVTINDLVAQARHEVVVFTDARQIFAKDAVVELVNNFADPSVGCVSGELIFSSKEGGTAKGINLYWNYEKLIRRYEAQLHSMLGATGAIYAIRRELYSPVPREVVLDDMYIPLKIIGRGYRAFFDATAKAYDEVADSPREEHRRKARTLYGNYQIFGLFPTMFIPLKSPIALQLFSHKLLRLLVPFFMAAVLLMNLLLLSDPSYRIVLFLQVIFYLMALGGALARNHKYGILKVISKVCYVPYVFCLMNFSALIGWRRFIKGGQDVTWEKARDIKK